MGTSAMTFRTHLLKESKESVQKWETIVWSFAATGAQKSSGMAAVPTILKTAISSVSTGYTNVTRKIYI